MLIRSLTTNSFKAEAKHTHTHTHTNIFVNPITNKKNTVHENGVSI
jgi:hypothetical protein